MTSDELIEKAAHAILAANGIRPEESGNYWGEGTWPNAVKDARAAFTVFEQAQAEPEWEYSIAYPVTKGGITYWETDGIDPFDTLGDAESELDSPGTWLEGDRIVRRRKAGPWEPVGVTNE